MKNIRGLYSKLKWRDRLITFFGLTILTGVFSHASDISFVQPSLIVAGILVVIHLILDRTSEFFVGTVILLHIAALSFSFGLYGQLASVTMPTTGYTYAVLLISLSTVLLTLIAYKKSVGRLWLTLLLTFVTLDFLSITVMSFLGLSNPLVGVFIASIVLASRCVLWRDFFRSRQADIPDGVKKKASGETIKALVEKIDGVAIHPISSNLIDFIVVTNDKAYYINTLSLTQRIAIFDENIASGSKNLKSTMFETAKLTKNHAKMWKKKNYKHAIPCVINSTDKGKSKTELNITITGNKRDKGQNVLVLSPLSLVEMLKQDINKNTIKSL